MSGNTLKVTIEIKDGSRREVPMSTVLKLNIEAQRIAIDTCLDMSVRRDLASNLSILYEIEARLKERGL